MLGSILGDIVGSRFEFNKELRNKKTTKFEFLHKDCFFTDDTVLTIATMDALLSGKSYKDCYYEWGNKYPNRGYGGNFQNWLNSKNPQPYNSWGNGSAMRVSPIGLFYNDLKTVISEAEKSAECTHNHEEGVKGAVTVAVCVYLAKNKTYTKIIKEIVETYFGYNLNRTTKEIRENCTFDVSCRGSVPEAIICFLESRNMEHAIRLAISLGGDTDTQGCIAGGISEADFFSRDFLYVNDMLGKIKPYLPDEMIDVIRGYYNIVLSNRKY